MCTLETLRIKKNIPYICIFGFDLFLAKCKKTIEKKPQIKYIILFQILLKRKSQENKIYLSVIIKCISIE